MNDEQKQSLADPFADYEAWKKWMNEKTAAMTISTISDDPFAGWWDDVSDIERIELYSLFNAAEVERPAIQQFWDEHAKWSQATFGNDADRGPDGPLKHLEKEAVEARENPSNISEFADVMLLAFDAARRAGHTLPQLVEAMWAKLAVNKARNWGENKPGEPVMHVKEPLTMPRGLIEQMMTPQISDRKLAEEIGRHRMKHFGPQDLSQTSRPDDDYEAKKQQWRDAGAFVGDTIDIPPPAPRSDDDPRNTYPLIHREGMSVVGPFGQVPNSDWFPWIAKNGNRVKAYDKGPHGPIRWTMIDGGPYACDVEKLLANVPNGD